MLTRLVAGWLALSLVWVFANPPFAAPDERDHYVRAVGISQGHLIGALAPDVSIGADPAEVAFDKSTQRAVTVPARLNPDPYNCYVQSPVLSAACLSDRTPLRGPAVTLITSTGDYPPLGLLAPAAVVGGAHDPLAADRLGRLAAMIPALVLLIAAALAVMDAAVGWLSLSGVLAAWTPTAVFLAASLNPSGMSVAAGVGMCAALLRIGRPGRPPGWVWTLLGVSGAALMLSHPTGLLWAGAIVGGSIALEGGRSSLGHIRRQPLAAAIGLGLLGLGLLAALLWQGLYGPSTPFAYRALALALHRAPLQTWNALRDLVAGFGYLEFRPPVVIPLLWFAFVGTLAALAIRIGSRRERLAVIIAVLLAVLIEPGVWLFFGRGAGIGIIGREYLPVLVALPMLAGEVIYRNHARLSRRGAVALRLLGTVAAILQFVAWYDNARRSAVGINGRLLFFTHPDWNPPLGWTPWLCTAAGGALLVATAALSRTTASS